MKIMTCVKQEFSAAHSLSSKLTDKCSVIHGHNYVVEACFTSDRPLPWVADFAQLKQIIKSVIDKLDHTYLLPERLCREASIRVPEVDSKIMCIPADEVTTENIAVYIVKEIERALTSQMKGVKLVKLRLYETSTSYVEIELE